MASIVGFLFEQSPQFQSLTAPLSLPQASKSFSAENATNLRSIRQWEV
jgi:hypothetical protein